MPTSQCPGRPLPGTGRGEEERQETGEMREQDHPAVTTLCSHHHTEAKRKKPQRDFPGCGPFLNISHLSLQYQQETPTLETSSNSLSTLRQRKELNFLLLYTQGDQRVSAKSNGSEHLNTQSSRTTTKQR